MRKPSRKTQKKKADVLFSKYIRSRGKCEWCGEKRDPSRLQCAHIFSRRFLVLRWNMFNALALCPACHFKGHNEPIEFAEFVKKKLGIKKYNELRSIRHQVKKPDYEVLIKVLKDLNE